MKQLSMNVLKPIFKINIILIFSSFLLLSNSIQVFSQSNKKEIFYLSGTDNENTVTWDFFCTGGRQSGFWTTIEVPSHWEQQGFGEYDYGRDYRTYGKKFKFADETGIYKYKFNVPGNWKEKEIFIVFEGSMTDTEVKINGQLAGPIHQGSFYRFRYNISDKLKLDAENELEVTVHKVSANRSVNAAERYADYWIFGGIFRPVYLEAFPAEYLQRMAISADMEGNFAVDVFPKNLRSNKQIEGVIYDAAGKEVGKCSAKAGKADSLVTLKCKVENPALWTSETPSLYKVKLTMKEGAKVLYETSEEFGFRTIEIRQRDGIYVNGTKVKLKGINRHVWWPETGRCINPKIDLMDVQLLKEMNMNAVRCSHYPPDQSFLNICDSLGIFVLDELAGWQNAYDTEVGSKLVKEMVIRDVNHPSIIFWSNGNEGGTNKELDDDFGIYDPSKRPVIHAHHRPGNDFNGIDCNHYETYYSSKKILADSLIYMPTEFLHGQDDGGMAAGLGDFWELFWESKRSAGGFLWTMVDEGIVRTDLDGYIDVNRLNAPDGVLGPHREKEGSFYAMREIFSPVKINLEKLPDNFDGSISLENRFHFTNLKDCRFEWQLVNFKSPFKRGGGHQIMESGKSKSPDVEPVKKGNLQLDLPANFKNYDALYLSVFDPFGKEIYGWSWKIDGNRKQVQQYVNTDLTEAEKQRRDDLRASGVEADNILPIEQQTGDLSKESSNVEFRETDKLVILKASGIAVAFGKNDGTIQSVGNDMGLPIPFHNGPVLVSGEAKLTGIKNFPSTKSHVIEMTYSGDMKKVTWTMYHSGWLEMNYEYMVEGKQYFTGISFDFPESDIIGAKWLGNGPQHVWKNRLQGGKLDVYQRFYNNILPADNSWEYPQFKGYFSEISWMEFNSVYSKFYMVANEDDLFVRLFDFYGISGPQNYPALPVGNISFLDGIPPVGTKLAMGISNNTWDLGPAGELNVMENPVKRTLWFYFGITE